MERERFLQIATADDYGRLREVFDRGGYTDEAVRSRLRVENLRLLSGRDMNDLLEATAEGTPLDVLIRLFLLGTDVAADATRHALEPTDLCEWSNIGLVRVEGESVWAELQIVPLENMLLAFDHPRQVNSGLRENHVMGVGSSTLTLSNLTVRRHSARTLDLGTGCGFLGLVAAAHSDHVLAVDCNPRAVELARFNAGLNGLENVECREGDLFEPVAGCRFELVVSNPPFVISPENRYIYRDSGMKGDEITQRIVREAPDYLSEGGFCQILCNWVHLADQPWQERLHAWFEGTDCDAWVMQSDTFAAREYAEKWIRHTERDDDEDFDTRLNQWLDYYREQRIEAIGAGLITMRRRTGATNWYRADDGPERMLGPAGESIAMGFALRDFLEVNQDDSVLLQQSLRLSPDARLHQELRPSDEGWTPTTSELHLERGLAYSGVIDPFVARLAGGCNGRRPLRELVAAMAVSLDRNVADITEPCLNVVRRLVERGFLLPTDEQPCP